MAGRKRFEDSVTPLPAQAGPTLDGMMVNAIDANPQAESMTLLFSLAVPAAAQAELEQRVAAGEVVSAAELSARYGGRPDDAAALETWLKNEGFEIVGHSADHLGIYGRATVAQIEKSLEVDMVRVTKDGLTYTAARNAPSLPAEVGGSVHAIVGLQPFRQAQRHNRRRSPSRGNRGASAVADAGSGLAAGVAAEPPAATTNVDNAPPYLVPEIMAAYGASDTGFTGQGQTIAILIDTFPTDADILAFWQANDVPAALARIQKINVKGVNLPSPEGEETLDVSWSSGVAPGATIRVYASSSLRFVDLDLALDRIIADLPTQPGLRQLSISLGLGERFMGGPNGEVAAQHQRFLRLAASGVNVFVSSGDAGSNPDETGHGSNGPLQAEYEASDSFVVGVGGTRLNLSATGTVTSESAWSSSGGGRSIFFKRPVWQKGTGVPAGTHRLVPDVSLAADPDTGAFLVFNNKVLQMGGTSWSAPVWAGFCALINEARTSKGLAALPFLNPLIYPLLGTPSFRDVKAGSNGAFHATAGYDLVTGLGVPDVAELLAALTQ